MKYKVGDRVRIADYIPKSEIWTEEARGWLGKVMTVADTAAPASVYFMAEFPWAWRESEIVGLAGDEPGEEANRKGILNVAKEKVCHDRKDQYGGLEDNFALIAKNWTDYLSARRNPAARFELEPHDVAVMMIYLKMARIATGEPKLDNWIDIAGYAACGGELQLENKSGGLK